MIYCIVPSELAAKLHEPLREHFRDDAAVEVVVEARRADRRAGADRRAEKAEREEDRRRVRSRRGRRVADRRRPTNGVEPPPLPDFAKPHAASLGFIERVEPETNELEDVDTARLVIRIQAGEGALFNRLYIRYFDRVYAYLRMTLNDVHEAEDAAQEVFIRLLEAMPYYEYRPGSPFRAWLFRIVRNNALNRLKRLQRMEPESPADVARRMETAGEPAPGLGQEGVLTDRRLLALVEQLPVVQRQVVMLRHMLDMDNVEIAAVIGKSPQAVRQSHQRAMRFLRTRLGSRPGPVGTRGETAPMRMLPKQAPVITGRRLALLYRM